MHLGNWEKSIWKGYMLYDIKYMRVRTGKNMDTVKSSVVLKVLGERRYWQIKHRGILKQKNYSL